MPPEIIAKNSRMSNIPEFPSLILASFHFYPLIDTIITSFLNVILQLKSHNIAHIHCLHPEARAGVQLSRPLARGNSGTPRSAFALTACLQGGLPHPFSQTAPNELARITTVSHGARAHNALNPADPSAQGSCLADGSARAPMKVVASCDKPRGGACSPRSGDCRMGPPAAASAATAPRSGTPRTEASQ